jgi:hypothetical protein
MKVLYEGSALEKRGFRCIGFGRRLGYLSVFELAKHNQEIKKKYCVEKAYHGHNRRRVA